MALYIFENITATQAANFTAGDTLIFGNGSTTANNVIVSNSGGLNLTTITAGTISQTFAGAAISTASIAGEVVFSSGGQLALGTSAGETITGSTDTQTIYGFAGNDSIVTGGGDDNIFAGAGNDSVLGDTGNEHIYGFGLTGDASTDGSDSINAGDGNDYVQGNAGDDSIVAGVGNDRVLGGSGNDTITGNDGNDTVNGNLGNDSIDGGIGNDSLRGGQGNDVILGGTGNDLIQGDLGNDSITGGAGIDVLTGGDGADVFTFLAADATGYATSGTFAYFTDTITDYVDGTDEIRLTSAAGAIGDIAAEIVYGSTGVTVTTVKDAVVYAQQLLDGNAEANDVAIVKVGGDSYLFYSNAGTTIDSIVKLVGVTDPSVLTTADFS